MNIEIDEASITNYANQRMKQLVDQKVKDWLAEIQWYKTVDHAIFDVVRQEITKEVVNRVLDSIDRAELVKSISMDLAELWKRVLPRLRSWQALSSFGVS